MFSKKLIGDFIGGTPYKDHYGVEIEVELENPFSGVFDNTLWAVEDDGSLRGYGYEFVLKKPLPIDKAKDAVKTLLANLNDGNKVIDNGRAGVHVHVNIKDLSVKQAASFITLAVTHEELLAEFCGEYRKGNLFCLRSRDAEYSLNVLNRAFKDEDLRHLHTDEIRYAFLNFKAIPQYGSVEFRGMRSDGDAKHICDWLSILGKLKEMSRKVDGPVHIIADVSERTPEGFVNTIMGNCYDLLPKYKGWEDDVLSSIRRVQLFAYAKEW